MSRLYESFLCYLFFAVSCNVMIFCCAFTTRSSYDTIKYLQFVQRLKRVKITHYSVVC